MMDVGLTIKSGTAKERLKAVEKALGWTLRPRNVSDRTCLRRVLDWLHRRIERQPNRIEELLGRVLDAALEASR